MKVTVIPIIIDGLGKVIKGLVRGLEDLEIRGQMETIQTTALLRSARILRRILETEETCCQTDFREKPSNKAGMKNSQKIEVIIIIIIERQVKTEKVFNNL